MHRARSHTAAARTLGTNQSTVGRRLAVLEATLGAKLFFRAPDGHVLTPAGERLLARAERMEDESLAIGRELAGDEGRLVGTIRITGPDAFSARILTPILSAFSRRAPDVDLELVADNRPLSLSKREADMAVRVHRPREPTLVVRRLSDFGVGVYASRAYVEEHGMPRPDFAGHLAIGFEEAARGTADARWLAREAKKARIVFRANSTFAQLSAAKEGVGIAVLPAYLASVEPELVEVLPPDKVVMESLWLVLHQDLQHSAKIRALADFLTMEIAKIAPLLRGTHRRKKR